MPEATAEAPTINDFLAEPLTVGDPEVAGPLTLFPLFGPEPAHSYVSFAQAHAQGVKISELEGGASVNDLLVFNPTDDDVLLFDGEEVLGAQQNRTLDVTVLVAANSRLQIPVSCVEAGRWDGARHREAFAPSPQAAYPRMRKIKADRVRANAFAGRAARADQGEVWDEADQLADRYETHSPTRATHQVYESRRGRLDEICSAITLHPGQVGAIAAYGEGLQVLDYVSRPDAYASLHTRLVQGYALDALDSEAAVSPEQATASGFALLCGDAAVAHRAKGVGLGEDLRFAAGAVVGSGLEYEGELVQLTAFPGSGGRRSSRSTACRPSA